MRILLANFSKMVGDTGGAAKVNVAFANEMVRRGHAVTTVYTDDREGAFFYPLNERVTAYNLQHFRGTHCTFPTVLKIKREVLRTFGQKYGHSVNNEFVEKHLHPQIREILTESRPDIIICFQIASAKTFLCDLRIKTPVIIMAHGDTRDYFYNYPDDEVASLRHAAACQALLPAFAEPIREYVADFPVQVEVIGNVVPQYEQQADLAREKDVYKVVFVGRLVRKIKQPHLLVQAFIRLAADFPQWTLEFWGAEDKRYYQKTLQRMVEKAGLSQRIRFCGTTKDVPRVLEGADICVAPSAYEGFSLAHTEAMSMGLPLIGYKSCVSVAELIDDGVNGLLAEDGAEALSEKMALLMRDRNLRTKMGAAARKSMRAYAPEIIWGQWETLMDEVISTHSSDRI